MKSISEFIYKRVNVDSRFCTVKGHSAFSIIQKHTHLPGSVLQRQRGDRRGVGSALTPSLQAQSPETICGADGKLALPVYRLSSDTQVPFDLFPNLHFPIAPPAAEAFFGQHVCHTVEPFGVIRNLLKLVCVAHLFSVIRDQKEGVGCFST